MIELLIIFIQQHCDDSTHTDKTEAIGHYFPKPEPTGGSAESPCVVQERMLILGFRKLDLFLD